MRIVIELPTVDDLTLDDQTELVVAVRYAVAEYIVQRSPAEAYVARRYASMTEQFRIEKLERVRFCVETLSHAEVNVPLDSVHSTPAAEYAPWLCKHCRCEIDIQQHAEGCPDR
jgi:hypothetical protein